MASLNESVLVQEDLSNSQRGLGETGRLILRILAVSLSLFQIYTAVFGMVGTLEQRAIHLALASGIGFLTFPMVKGAKIKGYDWLLAGLALLSAGYVAVNASAISNRFSYITPLSGFELVLGIIGIVVLLELARRMMGLALPLVVVAFLIYVAAGPYIPGILGHRGFSAMWTVDHIYFTPSGVFGVPLGVSSTYVAIFVIFGALLSASGGGQFLTNFALAAMGGVRGGPAKIATVASALFGMICGAATGNVVTTGSVTIPLMRKMGFEKHFAGAVEAVASTGGEIMPPIMGAAAFIMSQLANIPYKEIAFAAAIPAVLYYLAVYTSVDLEALRRNLSGLAKGERPVLMRVLRDGWIFLIPIGIILYMIFAGYTPIKAGAYALLANIVLCYLQRSTWLSARQILDGLESAACNLSLVAVACALAGVLVGVVTLTDLGLKASQMVIVLSGGNLFVALILSMVVAIILGMGMPPSAAYIVEAVLVAPALEQMGLPALVAHLFIFYYTVLSAITPPVAVAAFAAAGICGGNPMRVGWIAVRMGLPGLIIPFMFVYSRGLLLQGDVSQVLVDVVTSAIGVVSLAIGLAGNIRVPLGVLCRFLFLAAGLLLVSPGPVKGAIGLGALLMAYMIYRRSAVKKVSDVTDSL
ncbi:TRAP C4-dicarboxylate transport system permease DctM subunit [Moorella glycerini]|uniref:Sialic acid TRAP transporter permease protein SiaT n=1 Tax=Neomoorella stamsii TaxID=1266720 RepID=A0A9X7P6L0_9FIRM|nr:MULTISPECIES: TRAP transporter permease [Moorella]PRR73420.1 Sialic acid TRAP transporter permease protein SiaT [Moorella stamsii]CEP69189.1 TRAP C4-dicarboxylate transport system permease DctM subunit [Moorella glycerini]